MSGYFSFSWKNNHLFKQEKKTVKTLNLIFQNKKHSPFVLLQLRSPYADAVLCLMWNKIQYFQLRTQGGE